LSNDEYPKVVPYGTYGTSDGEMGKYTRENVITTLNAVNYACNKNARGQFCAALIMIDGWKISSDYPW
jgi:hypothetical protein